MCGRFVIDDGGEVAEIRKIFDELKKHYGNTIEFGSVRAGEIYPGDVVPVIIPSEGFRIEAVPMRWGMMNNYNGKLLPNARSEGAYEKSMFRESMRNKRCIIPANGFFEWARFNSQNKKEKFLIRPVHSPVLYFAGIYEKFPNPSGVSKEQARFVIMTREAKGHIRSIHSRMPVTVERRYILKWLNGESRDINEIFNDPVPEYAFTNMGSVG